MARCIIGTYMWFYEGTENVKVSEHFKAGEFKPRGGSSLDRRVWAISIDGLRMLETMRQTVNETIRLNTAYRPPGYNAHIDGAYNSWHQVGAAYDVAIPPGFQEQYGDNALIQFAALGHAVGFNGIGLMTGGVHFSFSKEGFFDERHILSGTEVKGQVQKAAKDWNDR